MRIARLDLIRYGVFTDRRIELPAGPIDLHVVIGLNEAGKSTAQAALDDLLFGFERTTKYGFLHDVPTLRVGAVLEHAGATLEVQRKKGNKETLRDASDRPLPEGALRPLLGAADRDFFRRMFSLDHQRLREGGRNILDSKEDVGRLLFEAGAGLSGLGDVLKALDEEAEGIYAPRASATRTFYVARERIKTADQARAAATVQARQFQEAVSEQDRLLVEQKKLDAELHDHRRERHRLERIRRVLPILAEIARCDGELEMLGRVPVLPADSATTLRRAEQELAQAESALRAGAESIAGLDAQLEAISVDGDVLRLAEEVTELARQSPVVDKARADLPRRETKLAGHERRIAEFLRELDRDVLPLEEVEKLLPPRTKAKRVRGLIEEWGGREARLRAAQTQQGKSAQANAELRQQLAEKGPPPDGAQLTTAIRFARDPGLVAVQALGVCDEEIRKIVRGRERAIDLLRPWQGTLDELRALAVPDESLIAGFAARFADLAERRRQMDGKVAAAEEQLDEHRLTEEQAMRDDGAVPAEAVVEARGHRDAGWALVRHRYVEGTPVSDELQRRFAGAGAEPADLPAAYEASVRAADDRADRRFGQAQASARLVNIRQHIESLTARRTKLVDDRARLEGEQGHLASEWRAAEEACGLASLDPPAMGRWLANRANALELGDSLGALERKRADLRSDGEEALAGLAAPLAALGFADRVEGQPLAHALEIAATREKELAERATDRRTLERQLKKGEADLKTLVDGAAEAARDISTWRAAFGQALVAIGRDAGEAPDVASSALGVLEELREEAVQARTLVEQIAKIRQDVTAFEKAAARVARQLAGPDQATATPETPDELARRLEAAKEHATRRQALSQQRDVLVERGDKTKTQRDDARTAIDLLLRLGECDDVEELRETIERAAERERLRARRDEETPKLAEAGDGLTAAELAAECAGVDRDGLKTALDEKDREIEARTTALRDHSARSAEARRQVEVIAGGADAAAAESDRQQALTTIREEAERWVRVHTAARLLRWAIDRWRKDKQAPLLGRASELFRTLTLGAFESLTVDYDEDQPRLAGVRPGGRHVNVDGLSDGTLDQLYLALRVAAVEEYLNAGEALPFVADDVFINFDDERAAAGFRVLAELARRTQVLFFTHHLHLGEVAERALAPALASRHQL